MLAISMVTAAMSIAIGAEPIWVTEENDLLEFAVTSGELVIRRLLRCRDSYVSVLIFHLFYLSPDCLTVIHSLRTPF